MDIYEKAFSDKIYMFGVEWQIEAFSELDQEKGEEYLRFYLCANHDFFDNK